MLMRRRRRCRRPLSAWRGGPVRSRLADLFMGGDVPMAIEPPLSFSIRHEALRVRLPLDAISESPARLVLTPRSAARVVWDIARGKARGERVSDLPVDRPVA